MFFIFKCRATGGDLFHSLELQAKFNENDARRIFQQILKALQYLHNEKNTAHRDLKVCVFFFVISFEILHFLLNK